MIDKRTELAEEVRAKFEYQTETGRLVRVARGRGAKVGVEVGSIDPETGHRRAYLAGRNRMTAQLVWAYHYGSLPSGILRHKNGDNSDDRIENLELLKKQLPVSYSHEGSEVSEYGRLPAGVASGIYEIRCMANGRRYIGSAVKMEKRWRLHYTQLATGKHHSRHLQRAWDKYGESLFMFRVVELCGRAELLLREQHYIDTLKPEFNSRPNASSQLGWHPTEETRQKMRESRAGKSSWMKGKSHTEQTKQRISESRKGKGGTGWTQERKDKISAAHKGRVISIEHRARISATLTGHKQSPEQIEKRMQKLRGRKMPDGFAEAQSARRMGIKLDAEHCVNIGRAKAKLDDDQVRSIRQMLADGVKQKHIALQFGVDPSVISTIKTRTAYAWVE